ncbi:hypothetical protein BOA8489_02350 [Boseongicola aestuarii]|uniref:Uncharacterized protein n=1 Tax=Boseongicola aestuarii TaxID=1470561 RepID=A0A238J0U1_9RHOB|nr:hypothetical protein BOA8489_02350 [Boseongicola aestuarii]
MDFFLVLALCGLVSSIVAGVFYLTKRTVLPPKTPYDIWFSEAQKQSAFKLERVKPQSNSRLIS